MKKKLTMTMVVILAAALLTGALAPLAFAQDGEGETGWGGSLPPELQEYQGKVQEALATLQEPMERVRALAGELKEGRGAVVNALHEKGAGAVREFGPELRAYVGEVREAFAGMRELRSGMRAFRNIKREVVAAVRAGDTDTAIEVIESALARVDEARARLEGLAGGLEALKASQAELLDRINAWTPPED